MGCGFDSGVWVYGYAMAEVGNMNICISHSYIYIH